MGHVVDDDCTVLLKQSWVTVEDGGNNPELEIFNSDIGLQTPVGRPEII